MIKISDSKIFLKHYDKIGNICFWLKFFAIIARLEVNEYNILFEKKNKNQN